MNPIRHYIHFGHTELSLETRLLIVGLTLEAIEIEHPIHVIKSNVLKEKAVILYQIKSEPQQTIKEKLLLAETAPFTEVNAITEGVYA